MKKTKGDSLPKDPQQPGEPSGASLPTFRCGHSSLQTIAISTNLGTRTVTILGVFGPLAVHEDIYWENRYTITHIPTGCATASSEIEFRFICLRCAFECAEELSQLDWENYRSQRNRATAIWRRYEAKHNARKDATDSPHEGNG